MTKDGYLADYIPNAGMCWIYQTRYEAYKNKLDFERVVKVDGGYAIMTYSQYDVWRRQK